MASPVAASRRLTLIGMGTGDPEHMTLQGIRALNRADLILIPRKGEEKSELADVRRRICAELLTNPATRLAEFDLPQRDSSGDYKTGVAAWHEAIAEAWLAVLEAHPQAREAALLIWGDPALYDSSLRVAEKAAARIPLEISVIPGISTPQVLAAAHAVTLNEIGEATTITTGRLLRAHGWPEGSAMLAVMLDGDCAFESLNPDGIDIWWGAYLGMAEEIRISGPLAEAGPRIREARAEARKRHGWIMDSYLLRRRS